MTVFNRDELCDALSLSRSSKYELSFLSAACGHCHSLIVTDNGRVFGCGRNRQGEIGLEGSLMERFSEIPVMSSFDELMANEDTVIG